MVGATATATEMQNNFGKYLNMVINGHEVIVTKNGKDYVSSLTIANLIYVMKKELNPEKIEEVLKQLKLIFQLTDLNVSDITSTAEMKWNDFKDAIQGATAERIHADCIITRNVKDFKQSKVIAFTPAECLARI